MIPTAAFDYVRALVLERSGIALGPDKDYLVDARLAPVLRHEGIASIDDLVRRLRTDGDDRLRTATVEALATHETSFFRDLAPFDALRSSLLAEFAAAVPSPLPLRLWSAACATGQEPYSLAILVREHFPALIPRVKILATDFSTFALGRAKAGRFGQLEVNRGLPAPLLLKYFRRQGTDWLIADEVRSMVEFRQLNLVSQWPDLPRMHVVFLRNVLLYFDLETRRAVFARLRAALAPGAAVFLGGAESPMGVDDRLTRIQVGRASCFRVQG